MLTSKVSRISEKLYKMILALADEEGWTFLIATNEVAKNPNILIPYLTNK